MSQETHRDDRSNRTDRPTRRPRSRHARKLTNRRHLRLGDKLRDAGRRGHLELAELALHLLHRRGRGLRLREGAGLDGDRRRLRGDGDLLARRRVAPRACLGSPGGRRTSSCTTLPIFTFSPAAIWSSTTSSRASMARFASARLVPGNVGDRIGELVCVRGTTILRRWLVSARAHSSGARGRRYRPRPRSNRYSASFRAVRRLIRNVTTRRPKSVAVPAYASSPSWTSTSTSPWNGTR